MRITGIFRLLFLSALPVLALDEKPIVVVGGWDLGLHLGGDVTYQMADKDWSLSSAPSPSAPVAYRAEFVGKYGMNEQSDLELTIPMVYRDKDYALLGGRNAAYGGFERPQLAAKIRLGKTGTGLVAGFSIPMAHEKVVGFNPEWGFTLGGFGGYRKAAWWADGLATWSTTPENSSGFKPGDVTFLGAVGGIQLDEGIAPKLGLSYTYISAASNSKAAGAVHKIVATPGCLLQVDEEWTLDVRAPVVVSGANVHASAGLSVGIVGFFEN